MSQSQYVENIVSKYYVPTGKGSPGYNAASEIYDTLERWARPDLNEIVFSGSYRKNTGIKGEADVDLLISLKPETNYTMAGIYQGLYNHIQQNGYNPTKQDVSIGMKYNNVHIDLIPAKKQAGNTYYHSIYSNRRGTWTQTNIELHIKNVIDSGRNIDIKAGKIWKRCHNIDIPSFYLELSVMNALKGRSIHDHTNNFLIFLEYLRDSFVN